MGAQKSYKELSTDIRFRDSYQAWIDSGGTLAFPNGESRKEFCKRSICGFERVLTQALELKRAMPDKEIQIVIFCAWRDYHGDNEPLL